MNILFLRGLVSAAAVHEARHVEDQENQHIAAERATGGPDSSEAACPAELQRHIHAGRRNGPKTEAPTNITSGGGALITRGRRDT
ncbi:hypothetical protein NDU88_006468 [Pleurodeles waltl]|uniref:Secreted protein n=1 Tax=Pleurodeles waltl TaxID=8319 RepID=A0AAV7LQK8_PLEWA|nr:hypothetical protein NDU88_006468 [Pleurodeles waltl]